LFAPIAALVLSAAAGPPANPVIATWKLNVAKSTFTPGPGWRSQVRTYRAAPGGGMLIEWKGIGGHGEPMHVRFVSTLDGKDHPMTGSDKYDTLSAVRIDALTTRSEEKRDGKVVGIAIVKRSADGKVMTITDEGTDRKGQKFSQLLVFDRE
jgi:hypothetical protein